LGDRGREDVGSCGGFLACCRVFNQGGSESREQEGQEARKERFVLQIEVEGEE